MWLLNFGKTPRFLIFIIIVNVVVSTNAYTTQDKQHFRSVPENQHVIEGSSTVMECEIGNQRGRVQWAKDGFVLGFNRTIPGYPRYEMSGEGDDGVHHLKIYNATLSDDADYQCQVSPADGHPPIRATGRLTVLMAPTKIKLKGQGREDTLEVKEGSEVTLECIVHNAKPVASVTWLKNEKEIRLENREDKIEESSLDRRHNLFSSITVKLSADDDGSHYICRANHQALDKVMQASIRISVLYPPGPPIITGFIEGETIRAKEERMFTCKSIGGNPLGEVIWYRNDVTIDAAHRPMGDSSVNDYRFVVDPKDNGATYTCEVKNKLLRKPMRTSIKLNVVFPPEKVVVSGSKQARVGDNVTLTCSVENSNPPASVSWVVDGKPYLHGSTKNERSSAGGWHTLSVLSMTVPRVDRDLMFTCHATNEAISATTVDTYMLSVLRPPQPPEIYGYTDGMGIRVNQEQSITCVSRGGNPEAKIQWYRNGKKIPSERTVVDEVTSAKIVVLAEPKDNGAQLTCETYNEADPTPTSVSTTLTVYFPPDKIKVTAHPPQMRAGGQVSLTCRTGPSNPPAEISWLRGGFKLNGHLQDSKKSDNYGTSVTNVLLLNLTSADDGLTYTCQATNNALQDDVRDHVTLRVTYMPEFLVPPSEVVDAELGGSIILNLTAKANPEPIHYSWTHLGIPLPKAVMDETHRSYRYQFESPHGMGSRVIANGPILQLRNVTLADAGEYKLEASNEEGVTVAAIDVNVQYPAVITATSEIVTISPGEQAALICEANGNPLVQGMITWERHNYDFSKTSQSFEGSKSILKFERVSPNDTGVFTCIVDNNVGQATRANATLIVKSKPRIKKSELLDRAAAKLSSTGRLLCRAEGAPEVTFVWKKNGVALQTSSLEGKFINETSKTGLVTYTSFLEIRRVSSSDYGHYSCIAANALGRAAFSIHFTSPTRPDPPLALKVLNSTHNSVTLKWEPNFDGGAPQYFRIRYRTKSNKNFEYVDVYEQNIDTYSVEDLKLDTEYYFSIMSRNEIGHSDYIGEFVRASTLNESPPSPVPSLNVGREDTGTPLPALWVVIVVLVATALLALNISAIVCIIRRRRQKRGTLGDKQKKFSKRSSSVERSLQIGTVPSVHPMTRLEGSDQVSSKSTVNTMYAPSSYNDTMAGETLSSLSEKSRESSYNQEDSIGEYEGQGRKQGGSPYLIDQIDPPPEYASQTPSSQPSANYDPSDDYAEVLRRNAYNQQLGKGNASPDARGYMSYSYTPSPTLPNGGMGVQYHGGGTLRPSINVATQGNSRLPYAGPSDSPDSTAMQTLGLDTALPVPLSLEQHSIPSEHPSLTLDPNSITIDHPIVNICDVNRNGDLRVHPHTNLSTFNPSPVNYSSDQLQGHLV